MSNRFDTLQTTPQGGKSSPMLYGMGICCLKAGSSTVAEDIVLVSISKNGLDHMLNTCNYYAMEWQYYYKSLNVLL